MLKTLQAHQGLVRSLALSKDGKRLISASKDGTLNLWNTDTGKIEARMEEGTMSFQVVALSPDGTRLATGGIDRNITIWNLAKILQMHPVK